MSIKLRVKNYMGGVQELQFWNGEKWESVKEAYSNDSDNHLGTNYSEIKQD